MLFREYNISMIKNRLEDIFREREVNIEDLTKSIGISSKSRIYNWKRQEVQPSFKFLVKLADYFDCSIDYLVGRTDFDVETNFKKCPPFDVQLKKFMKQHKITQYKLIKDKVVNQNGFHNWFTLKCQPKVDTLIKLADYFNISIDELVGRV